MKPSILPFDSLSEFPNIKIVENFNDLVNFKFAHGINAICWKRSLQGDFHEIVEKLNFGDEITTLSENRLNRLKLSDAGSSARKTLIQDQKLLREHGLAPILDCIPAYPRDEETAPFPTDVYSFHADSANVQTDTYLCSYNVAASEGLKIEDAIRHADVPETRAKLLKLHDGQDDHSFVEFLKEYFFDLHYTANAEAQPFSFGLGNLWRITTQCPDSPVPPCIHRAPTTKKSQPARLLLIS